MVTILPYNIYIQCNSHTRIRNSIQKWNVRGTLRLMDMYFKWKCEIQTRPTGSNCFIYICMYIYTYTTIIWLQPFPQKRTGMWSFSFLHLSHIYMHINNICTNAVFKRSLLFFFLIGLLSHFHSIYTPRTR